VTNFNKKEKKMRDYPYPPAAGVRNIATNIILSIITCGIYGLFWQYAKMDTINGWQQRRDFSFLTWLLLGFITCGIFAIYYEYKMAQAIMEIQEQNNLRVNRELPLISILLCIFGLGLVSLAIQQSEINKFYNATDI
jgi:hypothetical protein